MSPTVDSDESTIPLISYSKTYIEMKFYSRIFRKIISKYTCQKILSLFSVSFKLITYFAFLFLLIIIINLYSQQNMR